MRTGGRGTGGARGGAAYWRRFGGGDAGFDHDVGRAAGEDQDVDIVAADNLHLALIVDLNLAVDGQPALVAAADDIGAGVGEASGPRRRARSAPDDAEGEGGVEEGIGWAGEERRHELHAVLHCLPAPARRNQWKILPSIVP